MRDYLYESYDRGTPEPLGWGWLLLIGIPLAVVVGYYTLVLVTTLWDEWDLRRWNKREAD